MLEILEFLAKFVGNDVSNDSILIMKKNSLFMALKLEIRKFNFLALKPHFRLLICFRAAVRVASTNAWSSWSPSPGDPALPNMENNIKCK